MSFADTYERLVVLNRIARSVIDSVRGMHPEYSATRMGASQRTTLRLNLRTLSLLRSASATKNSRNHLVTASSGLAKCVATS